MVASAHPGRLSATRPMALLLPLVEDAGRHAGHALARDDRAGMRRAACARLGLHGVGARALRVHRQARRPGAALHTLGNRTRGAHGPEHGREPERPGLRDRDRTGGHARAQPPPPIVGDRRGGGTAVHRPTIKGFHGIRDGPRRTVPSGSPLPAPTVAARPPRWTTGTRCVDLDVSTRGVRHRIDGPFRMEVIRRYCDGDGDEEWPLGRLSRRSGRKPGELGS